MNFNFEGFNFQVYKFKTLNVAYSKFTKEHKF